MADAPQDQRRRKAATAAARVPPHNLDAEASLLGAMLLSREAIAASVSVVRAGDFYKPAHGHVFDAITSLYGNGQPVDAVTVAEELRRASLLEAIGGPALLIELAATTPAISNAARYARIVEEHALLRRLIATAGEIAEIGFELPDDVPKAIDRAESLMFELAQRRSTDSTHELRELLDTTLNDLEALYNNGAAVTGVPTGYSDLDELLLGLHPNTLNIVGARPSMGKCVAWDTPILDPATGALVKAIELHRRGSRGEWVQVVSAADDGRVTVATPSAFIDDGVKPLFRVVTRTGRTIRTTATHPFLTESGWRPLAKLGVGVRVAVPRRLPFFGTTALPGTELALLAHLLGDGCLRGSFERRAHAAVQRADGEGLDARDVLRRHGLWHATGDDLDLPEAIFLLPARQLGWFLERLIGTNRAARVGDPDPVAFLCRSAPMARSLQHLLVRFGVIATLDVVTGVRGDTAIHRLSIEAADPAGAAILAAAGVRVPAWVRAVGATVGTDAASGEPGGVALADRADARVDRAEGTDLFFDEIVGLTFDGLEPVVDLTVPTTHCFVAGDVLVHNTAFALGIATHVAAAQGQPVLFFSLEMGHKELTQRILASEARVDSSKMRKGQLTEQDWSRIAHAIGKLDQAPLYIDDNPNVTVMEIRAKARRMKSRIGLGMVVIDYLQLMSGSGVAESRQLEVSEISRGLKILARELEAPVVALSQLSRGLEQRADKRPMLADLRESGSLEQDADVVMFIYRDEVYNADSNDRGAAEIIVAKHRNGPIGTRKLVFLGQYTKFENAARGV